MAHFDVLKRSIHFIWHLLDEQMTTLIEVIGDFFDDIASDADFVETQIDPHQAVVDGSLTDFERFYNAAPSGGDTVDIRRNRVVSKIRIKGGFNIQKFVDIATALGYVYGDTGDKHLILSEGDYAPFRADRGRADIDRVYDQDSSLSQYTVVVSGTDVETDNDLQSAFNRIHCAGTNFIFSNV